MNTEKFQGELEALGQRLQQALLKLSPLLQLQVRCGIRQENLLILVEHLLYIEPDPEQTFAELKRSLIEVAPDLFQSGLVRHATGRSNSLPVRAYLRIVGYQEPYQSQAFTLEPSTPATKSVAPPPVVPPAAKPAAPVRLARPVALPPPVPVILPPSRMESTTPSPTIAHSTDQQPAVTPELLSDEAQDASITAPAGVADEAIAPEIAESKAIAPEIVAPEAIAPAIVAPEIAAPEITEPETIAPEIAVPEIAAPEITAPEAIAPEIAAPEIVEPEIATPEAIAPEVAAPEIVETEAIAPEIVAPEIAVPEIVVTEVAAPEIIVPEAIAPEVAAPEIIVPEAIAPEVAAPEIVETEAIAPEIAAPEIVEPEIATPEAIAPEVAAPETVAPEIAAPESTESEAIAPEIAVLEAAIAPEIVEPEAVIAPEIVASEIATPEAIAPEIAVLEAAIVPETVEPEAIAPEIASPEIAEPEAIAPEISEPEIITSEIAAPEIAVLEAAIVPETVEPEAIAPEIASPEIAEPEAIAPEISEPEIITSEIAAPEIAVLEAAIVPETVEPEAIAPEIAAPEIAVLEAIAPEISEPEIITSEIAAPEIAVLEAAIVPETVEPEAIAPEIAAPEIAVLEAIAPEISEPEIITSEIAAPESTESEAIAPEIAVLEAAIVPETVEPEAIAPEIASPEIAEPEAIAPEIAEPETVAPEIAAPESTESEAIAPEISEPEVAAPEIVVPEAIATASSSPSKLLRSSEAPLETPPPDADDQVELYPGKFFAARLPLSTLMLGGAVGLFVLVVGAYALTRPCVLGSVCEPLQKAQQLDQQATQTIATTDSALAVVAAYDQLTEASYLLSTIPSWSGQYQAAQTLQATYESKSKMVGQVVKALKQANAAAQKSQNPPHSLPEWRQIQWDWREAIATLEKVPPDSPVLALSQKKLAEYKVNLRNTDQRVLAEQSAQNKVMTARKTAEVAESRAGIATTSESWQQVYLTWQAAIDLLKQVPQGTMAYAEAQQFINLYQSRMAEADNQRNQEQVSTGSYQDAVKLAEQARTWERQNQWTQAVGSWRKALTNVQQIPQGTAYYTQAQPLISEYQTALTQAEASLSRSRAMQSAKPDLDRTCLGTSTGTLPGASQICTYTLSPDGIRIQITPQYDQAVENAITRAQTQGNTNARTAVTAQVNELLQNLAEVGKTAQVPIELYNSDGSIFANYMPDKAGYVAR